MARAIDEGNMSHELILEAVHHERVLFRRPKRSVTCGTLALFVLAPINLVTVQFQRLFTPYRNVNKNGNIRNFYKENTQPLDI